MRRKSERNKTKSSPEKKMEKPTRRITRRKGKTSPSTSPGRESTEDNVSSTPYSEDDKDSNSQFQNEEDNDSEKLEKDVTSSGLIKSVLGGDEEDSGSVWKVARADASPGEIQKLKLCRQRNISEASDSSTSKRKSNKWPDSGDGGSEEAESVDEQVASSQMPTSEQTEDPSSLHPGQDSNEEVSDYKENLPETTSANLSDDQTHIDQADFNENPQETTSTNFDEAPAFEDNQSSSSANAPIKDDSSRQPHCEDKVAELTSGDAPVSQPNQDPDNTVSCLDSSIIVELTESIETNLNDKDKCVDNNNENLGATSTERNTVQITEDSNVKDTSVSNKDKKKDKTLQKQDSTLQNTSVNDANNSEIVIFNNETNDTDVVESQKKLDNDEEEEEGEIRDEVDKEPSPDFNSAKKLKEKSVTGRSIKDSSQEIRSSRRKHGKYRESSSDTLESGDERNLKIKRKEANSQNVKDEKKSENRKARLSKLKENTDYAKSENDPLDSNVEKEYILEINEKSDDLNLSLSSKPTKVSLKRSFSNRLSTDSETKKEENTKKNENETNQNKENHADNEQPDQKCPTKRRRWGSTATADVAPAFSISTDSLKALVPGAKPVSANEVKLTKDEDDEKEQRKRKNKSESKSNSTSKTDVAKKSESKTDNHTTSRRKITLVKETPRPTSPSPPEAQATNILLIKNLVRPFTLNQIKELLARTGTIVENGFWIDRIKSKCFVEYANEDQAFETRQALHGVSWPVSNPKKLIVEYANKIDMELARESSKEQTVPKKADVTISTDLWRQESWAREERPKAANKLTLIREWDVGKEDGQLQAKEKERERKEFEKKKRQRSRSPIIEVHLPAPARKFKKKEEEPPTAKLLDDLFRKTKATPCIYWLPLTNEQIAVKEEIRRQHMAEHARRLEEIRRAERGRSRGDIRRRRSPRK